MYPKPAVLKSNNVPIPNLCANGNGSLPLHPDIEARWRNGQLTRVHADGSAWQDSDGDPFAVLSGEAEPDNDSEPTTTEPADGDEPLEGQTPGAEPPTGQEDQPPRPRGNAPRKAWAEYAVTLGVTTAEQADLMTRDELRKACTPPEMKPADPGD